MGKYIEADRLGQDKGKGSSEHAAAVVGDTIGDPFKDTSGPALNILIKLMTMMSMVGGHRCRCLLFSDCIRHNLVDEENWIRKHRLWRRENKAIGKKLKCQI